MKEMLLVLLVWFLGLQEVFGSTIHRFIVPSRVFSERSETSSPDLVTFAAKELRRYLYLTTGRLPSILQEEEFLASFESNTLNSSSEYIYVSTRAENKLDHLFQISEEVSADYHIIRTFENLFSNHKNIRIYLCIGANDVSTLYSAYTFAENLGVRFYIHGDVIGKHWTSWLPSINQLSDPYFETRGIQPFHDFSEGPDWWGLQEYKLHISQILKMKMNFIGLHTYPLAEPTVWVGVPSDFNSNGTVKKSYPTSYQNSLRGDWGYTPMITGNYNFGNYLIFDKDCYGVSPILDGACPKPTTPVTSNRVFDLTGEMFSNAFSHAKDIGVQTCVGTEIPMTKPDPSVDTQTYYEGIFQRIMASHHLDYYWMWTPEIWEWDKVNTTDPVVQLAVQDLNAAYAARKALSLEDDFQLATCGWVLGPLGNRSYLDSVLPSDFILSSIDMDVGNTPVDPAYGQVTHHKKWVIPWMEDDPGLTVAELWVNRTLEHGLDAYKYGAQGLLGIHWRTVVIAPQLSAMAQFHWNLSLNSQSFWLDWATHSFGPEAAIQIANIFISVDSFKTPRPVNWVNGPGGLVPNSQPWSQVQKQYTFVDQLISLRGKIVGAANKERFEYWVNTFSFMKAVAHVEIQWYQYDSVIQTIVAEPDPVKRAQLAAKLGVPARIDLVNLVDEMMGYLLNTVYSTGEMGTIMNIEAHSLINVLYGREKELAYLLGGCDSRDGKFLGCYIDQNNRDLSGPSTSTNFMTPEYCSSFCIGYHYYGVQFGSFCFCGDSYGKYGKASENDCNMTCVGNSSELCGGTWRNDIYFHSCNISGLLPPQALPTHNYTGAPRLIVPTVRTNLQVGESFTLTAMVLSKQISGDVLMHIRLLGTNFPFHTYPMTKKTPGRQVYTITIASQETATDFEYYLETQVDGVKLIFPVEGTQTVVIGP